ncbi:MAG: SoxR reducing system RseC family protein [Oscillospiraceae bacterium]|nr:SoxR reducing system RseC family protein [Oscillospiraceae bacterium]
MEQLVRIKDIYDDGTALVIRMRESACSGDCRQCSGCGAVQQTMLLRAVNTIGAKPGELVIVEADSKPVLASAAVLYLLPLVLFFAGYLAGELLWGNGALTGCAAFVLSIVLAIVYDRRVAKKQNHVYTITGYPGRITAGSHTKGDNSFD